MQVIVFEDAGVERLWPLTSLRPACDITIGAQTLCQTLGHIGSVRRVVRPPLAQHVAAIADSRVTLWGVLAVPPVNEPLMSRHGALTVIVNARVVPSRATIVAIRSLVEAGHRGIVLDGDTIAAAIVHRTADGAGADDAALRHLIDTGSPEAIAALGLGTLDCGLELLHEPHDIVTAHEWAMPGLLAMLIDSGRYQEVQPGLFVAADVTLHEPIVVRRGPVVVESGAAIGPFVCLDGPVFVGHGARVNPHAWIREATTIGADCRVGGEIEASVMEPFSNKPHDGYLGHSHLGSWVNLAAGTITANLKVSYGTVRLRHPADTVDTGRQFLGAMVGDLAKTAINTSLPCGARVGAAATVGGAVPDVVPAFHNQLVGRPDGSVTTSVQAATVLERMMARRGLGLLPADRELLEAASPA
jgi:UDP-N-acetylglucosamine diphosphorylase / glucose-1-phosphate thymidylyltransferase / UDP-N-acetylgalactosamine diphosphorylase / glucosamine-1-phosphate N-acetyltransferase / galactosamine-1-phosphate N-acetyltransferase